MTNPDTRAAMIAARDALKPCPFCGSAVTLETDPDDALIGFVCDDGSSCKGTGLATYALKQDLLTAIVAWNRRVTIDSAHAAALIETAPKDGTDILVFALGRWRASSWGKCRPQLDGYCANDGHPCWRADDKEHMSPLPTHWMPMPEPLKDTP